MFVHFRATRGAVLSRIAGSLALPVLAAGVSAAFADGAAPPPTAYQVAPTVSADPPLVIIDGVAVGAADLAPIDETVGRNILSMDPAERRDTVLQMVGDAMLLAAEARRRGLTEDADTKRRVEFARNQGLMNQVLAEVGREAVTEDAMRKLYDSAVTQGVPRETEYRLRHLVFILPPPAPEARPADREDVEKAVEAKAAAASSRLAKGEDFVALVSELAEDPVMRARGGDFDWQTIAEMGREYAEAVEVLKPGEVSKPFKSAVGWHLVRLEETRERRPESYEQMRDRLAALLASQAQYQLLEQVRAKAKIERFDLKPEAQAAAR